VQRVIFIILFLVVQLPVAAADAGLSDSQIRQLVIKDSIASYPGRCACPYTKAANGSECGKGSAWNTAGDYAPLCYPTDVDKDVLKAYRQQHGL
jgi:hypothetical protein